MFDKINGSHIGGSMILDFGGGANFQNKIEKPGHQKL